MLWLHPQRCRTLGNVDGRGFGQEEGNCHWCPAVAPSRVAPRPGSFLAGLPDRARVLVLRGGNIGDVVVIEPALRALRAALPRAEILLGVQKHGLEMARRLPWPDELRLFPRYEAIQAEMRGDACEAVEREEIARLRSQRYDLILQCSGGGETLNPFIRSLVGGLSAGCRQDGAANLDLTLPYSRYQQESERLMDIVEAVGGPRFCAHPRLEVTNREAAEAAEVCPGLPPRFITVHAGSSSGARRWPAEKYAEVLDSLVPGRLPAVLIGGPADRELVAAVRRTSSLPDLLYDASGRLSLGALGAVLQRATMHLGSDSGPAHIARAVGTPTVTIFGSAHPATWGPVSRTWHRVVSGDVAPCRADPNACGCPDDATAKCIASVREDQVLEQASGLLDLLLRREREWPGVQAEMAAGGS